MTQFGRALAELNIEILCANSSQAKGRVERANRTLQDRLIKEMRIAGISSMEDGNAFLEGFMNRFNAKFAKAPTCPDNLHRALNIEPSRFDEVVCLRDKRCVSRDLTLKYDHKRIKLEVNDLTRGLVGKYIDVYEMADGRFQVRVNGIAASFSIINPERRVTHAAIAGNKYLSAILTQVKADQDKKAQAPVVKPTSSRSGYKKKKGPKKTGRKSFVDRHIERKRVQALKDAKSG